MFGSEVVQSNSKSDETTTTTPLAVNRLCEDSGYFGVHLWRQIRKTKGTLGAVFCMRRITVGVGSFEEREKQCTTGSVTCARSIQGACSATLLPPPQVFTKAGLRPSI